MVLSRGGQHTERAVATVLFWALTVVVLSLMFEDRKSPGAEVVEVVSLRRSHRLERRPAEAGLPARTRCGTQPVRCSN